MGELLIGCSGWNYGDTTDKEDDRSILSRQQHKEAQILLTVFLIQRRWIQFFMKSFTLR
jgi:hypothetical protein